MDLNTIKIFGITLNIDPVAFTLPFGGGFDVYWYGIIIALGFTLALIYAFRRCKEFGIDPDRMTDVIIVALLFGIIGARAYYIIFNPDFEVNSFKDVIGIHNGGLAIYGGVIGAFLSAAVMCKIRKVKILPMFDLAALGFLIGQACGRWGNFVNQEAYGSVTGSDWFGMTGGRIASQMRSSALVHPCFLYESVWCVIGFILLHRISRRRKFDGQIITGYMMWYGAGRFIIEGLRTDSLYIGSTGIRVSQVLSLVLIIAGAAFYALLLRRSRAAEESTYTGVFDESGYSSDGAEQEETAEKAEETSETAEIGEIAESEETEPEPAENADGAETADDARKEEE